MWTTWAGCEEGIELIEADKQAAWKVMAVPRRRGRGIDSLPSIRTTTPEHGVTESLKPLNFQAPKLRKLQAPSVGGGRTQETQPRPAIHLPDCLAPVTVSSAYLWIDRAFRGVMPRLQMPGI